MASTSAWHSVNWANLTILAFWRFWSSPGALRRLARAMDASSTFWLREEMPP